MKYLIIICILTASCSSLRKSVNQQKQEINKSVTSFRDSIVRLTVDSVVTSRTFSRADLSVDSAYEKVTEEVIKEVIDSGLIRRETTRTIKEKGQKRTEQIAHTSKYDSASSMITEHSQLQEIRDEDSTATVVTVQKDVKRLSLFPWWIWLIVAGVAVLAWWKRNSIIDFLT